ncbi:uncharacterized protein [Bos taurus]|uniref:uncharacterized protein isoform X2 n=1 Tax=Bos taurus TaxID=9913 RepID=UPI0028CB8C1D|nr:uncharacterized protein LOC104970180 isoform X2 [Bos taurus]
MDSSPLPPRLGKLRLTGDPGFKSVGEPALQGQVPRDPMHPSPCRRSSKGLTSRRPQPEVTPEPLTTALRRPPWRGGLRRRGPTPPRTRLPCVASWPRPPAESRVRASVVVRRSPEEARFSPAQRLQGVQASAVVALRLGCPTACGIFLDQGSNL